MAAFTLSLSPEPFMMVHRGWKDVYESLGPYEEVFRLQSLSTGTSKGTIEQDKRSKSPRKLPHSAQEFPFINQTTPGRNKDPEVKKFVRGHVVKDTIQKKRLRNEKGRPKQNNIKPIKPVNRQSGDKIQESDSGVSSSRSAGSSEERTEATLPRFSQMPLDPHPQLSPIIYHITEMGNAMYPHAFSVRFNPLSPTAWFDRALRDEALFHALLYTTSSYAGLVSGTTESKEAVVHFGKSVALVKERLESMCDLRKGKAVTVLVEDTARAVSCLAFTEVVRGNVEGWKVHMTGMKQMVDVRGGITKFSIGLQLKLHRADLFGATYYLSPPFFSDSNGLPHLPSRDVRQSEAQILFINFLNTLPISPDLSNSLIYMAALSQEISRILSNSTIYTDAQQITLLKHTYSLRYSLLPSFNSRYLDPGTESLEEVLRIGALLYIQATPREFPHAAVGQSNLVERLKELVLSVQMCNEKEGVLVMWLLFMGAMSARKGGDRIWFVAQIEKLIRRLGFGEWGEVKGKLKGLWWVSGLHDKGGKEVLGEVKALREVMRGKGSSTGCR